MSMADILVWGKGPAALVVLAGLCLVLLGTYFAQRRLARRGAIYRLRPIAAYDVIAQLLARSRREEGIVCASPGFGHLGTLTTSEALAGLSVAQYLLVRSEGAEASVVVANADAGLHLLMQNILGGRADLEARLGEPPVQFVAAERAAFALGANNILGAKRYSAGALVGRYGDEYLVVDAAAEGGTCAGTVEAAGLAAMELAAEEVSRGEEVYAAGAYLLRRSPAVASLAVQDLVRLVVVLLLVLVLAFGLAGLGSVLF